MKLTNASKSPALRLNKETLKTMVVRTGVRTGDVACPPVTHTCPTTYHIPSRTP